MASVSFPTGLPPERGRVQGFLPSSDLSASSSSESEEGQEESLPHQVKLPIFSIHKIRINPREVSSTGEAGFKALEVWIDRLIASKEQEDQSLKFRRIDIPDQEEWWNPIENNDFHLRLFYCYVSGSSKIAHFLRKAHLDEDMAQNISTNYLFFFYRELQRTAEVAEKSFEVFALTQGHSWRIISSRDFKFPDKVIKRLAQPVVKKESVKDLVGPVLLQDRTYKDMHASNLTEHLYTIVQRFETVVKKEASLRACPPFLTKKGKPTKRKVTLERKIGCLRLGSSLSLAEYASVLDHFSKITRGENTYLVTQDDSKVQELDDPNFDYLDFVQLVALEKSLSLWEGFKALLYQACFNGRPIEIYLCPKFADDFFKSPVTIEFKGERVKKWDRPPSIREFFRVLRRRVFRKKPSQEEFYTTLESVTIGFIHGGKYKPFPVLDCVEGEYKDKTGKNYFLKNGVWQKASAEYINLLQRDFLTLLNTSLIDEQDPAFLPIPWMCEPAWSSFSPADLVEILGSEKEAQNVVNMLDQQAYPFIDSHGKPLQNTLFGKIKKDEKFKSHWRAINKLLARRKPLTEEVLIRELLVTDKEAKKILEALKMPCKVFRRMGTETSPRYVVMCPIKVADHFPRMSESKKTALEAFLKQRGEFCLQTSDEGDYNEQYLYDQKNKGDFYGPDAGWLVGDRICPDDIELFDILQYDATHVYLYAVKETFGEETRAACAQIRISAQRVQAALETDSSTDILTEFYVKVMNGTEKTAYRKNVKKQLEHLTQAGFRSIFTNKKIIFVYAFIDSEGSTERLLSDERHIFRTITLSPQDFNREKCLNFRGNKNISPEEIFKLAKEKKYLNDEGHPTDHFLLTDKKYFALSDRLGKTTQTQAIFEVISDKVAPLVSQFKSIGAKMELVRLKRDLHELGTDLKICQIRRPAKAVGYASFTQPSLQFVSPPSELDALMESLELEGSTQTTPSLLPTPLVSLRLSGNPPVARVSSPQGRGDDPSAPTIPSLPPAGDAMELDELASLPSLTQPTASFTMRKTTYQIIPTQGKGSCALHALLGEDFNGVIRFSASEDCDLEAKRHFLRKLKEAFTADHPNIKDLLFEALSQMSNRDNTNDEKRMVFLSPDILELYHDYLHQKESLIAQMKTTQKEEGAEWIPMLTSAMVEIIKHNERNNPNYNTKTVVELQEIFQKEPYLVHGLINSDRKRFLSFLDEEQKMRIVPFQIRLSEQEQALIDLKKQFFFSQQLLEKYEKAFLDPSYYLSQAELTLAAYLFQKRVILFSHLQGEYRTSDQDVISPPHFQDEVLIAHQGVHYERVIQL